MLALLASVHHGDLSTVLFVVAIVTFVLAVLCAFRSMIEAAVALALIGVLLLIFS